MASKMKLILLLLVLLFALTGCGLLTLEELYCLPKRSEDYEDLQLLIDEAMEDLTYCAPLSGDNRQSVQTVDLDGDGTNEYLLFAKDDSEKPLKILIYSQVASGYVLMDTIEGYGFAFDFVQYAQMDDKPGLEIIVGRQVSEDLARSISVYRFSSGYARQMLATGYTGMACEDMNQDGIHDLILFTDGVSERGNGIAVLYTYAEESLQRGVIAHLSRPITYFRQATAGLLQDGSCAVFVTSEGSDHGVHLDVLAIQGQNLQNLAEGIYIPSVRNFLLYPEDIDSDGVVEIPQPIAVPSNPEKDIQEYILQWYSLNCYGQKTEKAYTYHNYSLGWMLHLEKDWVQNLAVTQENNAVSFWRITSEEQRQLVLTIYTLTGSDRESDAALNNKIVLYKGDTIIYAVELSQSATEEGITEENILEFFEPIRKEWNTEEDGQS